MTIAELGCGVSTACVEKHSIINKKNNIGAGNSVFPLLASNKNPQLSLYAFDYASHAVKLVQVPRILLLLSALKLIHKGFIV